MVNFSYACPGCGARVTWSGSMIDRPPCPQCQARPHPSELEAADRHFRSMLQVAQRDPCIVLSQSLRVKREQSGLSMSEAAEKAGVSVLDLFRYERAVAYPSRELVAVLESVYGGSP